MSSLPRRASAPRNPAGPSAGLFAHVLGSPRLPHESDETSVRINPSLTLRCDKQPPMVIHGTMVEPPAGEGQQRADRLRLNLAVAGAVAPGQGTEVIVHNLSVSGVLIETAADLMMGQDIAIALPEAGDVVASVVWQSERLYGCRFRQPLPRAALSAARLRNPLPSDFDPADRADGDTDADAEETLGARLRRLRQARGLSLAGLAQAAGLSKPSIWAWENGTTAPRRTSLLALARALDVPEQQLTGVAAMVGLRASARAEADAESDMLRVEIAAARRRIALAAGVDAASVRIMIEL
jgi:transcriptional regulator with XRE-family HTH domain